MGEPDMADAAQRAAERRDADRADSDRPAGGDGDEQDMIDRSTIDFDPDDGLLSGTAVDGTSKIPGPHENGPDTTDEELAELDDEGESTATF